MDGYFPKDGLNGFCPIPTWRITAHDNAQMDIYCSCPHSSLHRSRQLPVSRPSSTTGARSSEGPRLVADHYVESPVSQGERYQFWFNRKLSLFWGVTPPIKSQDLLIRVWQCGNESKIIVLRGSNGVSDFWNLSRPILGNFCGRARVTKLLSVGGELGCSSLGG